VTNPMKPNPPPGPAMTLGNMRQLGVKRLSEVRSLRSAQNAPLLLRPDRRLGPLSACRFNPL
jgi:hypothetical protein